MRGLNLGSKPAEWSTSTTTTISRSTSYPVNIQTSKLTLRTTSYSTTTTFSTSKSTTTSWTTSKSTTTTFNTSRSTSKSTTTTFSTSRSTTTSWSTSRSTTTTFNTSKSTTTTFTTNWSTSKSTTTTFLTSRSTTTTWSTSRSTTTTYTTTFSTTKSTTTTFLTSRSTTTTWSTSRSTTTTFSTSKSTTTSWTTSRSTTTSYTTSWTTSWSTMRTTESHLRSTLLSRNTATYWNTSSTTIKSVSTSFSTSRFTSAGGPVLCVVNDQLVHVSTYKTTYIDQVASGSSILEMDTPFNVDNLNTFDELFEITSSVIDNGGGLQTGSITQHMIYSASGEIVNLNQYDLLITGDHPQPIFRSGSWMVSKGRDIEIGDGLLNISGSSPTGSFVWVWDIDVDTTGSYVVHKLDTEPHDVFFVNGFLTHNKDFISR